MASALVEADGREVVYLRGAAEVILERCTRVEDEGGVRALADDDLQALDAVAEGWGSEALRVVALAVGDVPSGAQDPEYNPQNATRKIQDLEHDLTFVALLALLDPPRPEVKAAVAKARAAGIRSLMITGDQLSTACAIGRELGLYQDGDLALGGAELDDLDDQRLQELVDQLVIVARATAANKLRIVEALKARGEVCAMTGDGVNDAPAVKSANVGIAMGRSGTDVTKEAADIVLADDNYATIVAAVAEGRTIYANIRKFISFLLASNAAIVLVVLVASLAGWASPLTPIQILWINLITNGLPALALGVDPRDPDEMARPPRPAGGSLFPPRHWASMAWMGSVMAAAALWAFASAAGGGGADLEEHSRDLLRARTLAFAILSLAPMFHALSCRSQTRSVFSIGLFSNPALLGAIAVGVALQAIAIYVRPLAALYQTTPLSGADLALVLALSASPLVAAELGKLVTRVRRRARAAPP